MEFSVRPAEPGDVEPLRRIAERAWHAAHGERLGFALAHPLEGGTFGLARIHVDPDRWGRGVGTALLEATEAAIHRRGGDRVRLGVIAGNDRAVAFYEARGYERIDEGYDERLEVRNYTYAKDLQSPSTAR